MNKEEQGKMLICVFALILGLLITYICNSIMEQEKAFEYALNGEIGVSSNCYYSDDAYCEIDNKVIRVDNYYIKED